MWWILFTELPQIIMIKIEKKQLYKKFMNSHIQFECSCHNKDMNTISIWLITAGVY